MSHFTPLKKFIGVSYYESIERKHKGKPDRCFYITYRLAGKMKREKVGWESEGFTAQTAANVRAERIRSDRLGKVEPSAYQPFDYDKLADMVADRIKLFLKESIVPLIVKRR